MRLESIQSSVAPYRDAPYYQPIGRRPHRGGGWALVLMPVAMLAIQYGLTFLLLKSFKNEQLRASTAVTPFIGAFTGSVFMLLSIACFAIGTLIVYAYTDDVALTVGYVGVRWLLGYFVSLAVTSSSLASLGIHVGFPGASQPGSGATSHARPGFRALNSQRIPLIIRGRRVSILARPELNLDGRLVTLERSVTTLTCDRAHGRTLRLGPTRFNPGAAAFSWTLPNGPDRITQCAGTVRLATLGQSQQNGPVIGGFRLRPWKIRLG